MGWTDHVKTRLERYHAARHLDDERRAIANLPLPKNSARLFAPVRVKVLRPFYVGGKEQRTDTTTELEYHVAVEMAAIGKAKIIS